MYKQPSVPSLPGQLSIMSINVIAIRFLLNAKNKNNHVQKKIIIDLLDFKILEPNQTIFLDF